MRICALWLLKNNKIKGARSARLRASATILICASFKYNLSLHDFPYGVNKGEYPLLALERLQILFCQMDIPKVRSDRQDKTYSKDV
ncbi:hypothetical protein KDA_59920 [Dictyobacter alpinus]|uniref:Uncharacterized protein n=1 Tax=Dictyobacter alpinus TaxID=2014873 RepID=A0A402BGF7_9CHLR|nr:hypothetical protein KDA_59920 [Dictyobacter alpinus]